MFNLLAPKRHGQKSLPKTAFRRNFSRKRSTKKMARRLRGSCLRFLAGGMGWFLVKSAGKSIALSIVKGGISDIQTPNWQGL